MVKVDALLHTLAGTRYRLLTTLVVLGYGSLALIVAGTLVFSSREAVYRIHATTEQLSIISSRPLAFGATQILAAEAPQCNRAALELPAGTLFEGRRRSSDQQTYLTLRSPQSQTLGVMCEQGQRLSLSELTVLGPQPKEVTGRPDSRGDPLRLVFRVAGTMTMGGQIDSDTPTASAQLLRNARVVVEVREWLGGSLVPVTERLLEGGGKLSFREDAGGEPSLDGLLIMTDTAFQMHVRFVGQSVVLTAPGAESGAEVVVAPGFFDRIKAQAQFGVWVLLATLLLGLLEALRTFETAPASARNGRLPTPERPTGGEGT